MIKNKRADITIMVLVIGVVGICILTILSFVKFNNDIDDDFLGIGLIETMLSIGEELKFYEETGFDGDYDGIFERGGNIKIIIKGSWVVNGTYYKGDKRIVFVEYKK